jgi:hypothetical protein
LLIFISILEISIPSWIVSVKVQSGTLPLWTFE